MWVDIGIAAFLLAGIYCVLSVFGWWASITTRRVNRRAEDWYDRCADSPRQQRRYAKEHGGEWTDEPGTWRDASPHSRAGSRH